MKQEKGGQGRCWGWGGGLPLRSPSQLSSGSALTALPGEGRSAPSCCLCVRDASGGEGPSEAVQRGVLRRDQDTGRRGGTTTGGEHCPNGSETDSGAAPCCRHLHVQPPGWGGRNACALVCGARSGPHCPTWSRCPPWSRCLP